MINKKILHKTTHGIYHVVLDPNGADNYAVVNADLGVFEYRCKTLPQAIGIAEQFDYMIHNNTWADVLAGAFGAFNMEDTPVDMHKQSH